MRRNKLIVMLIVSLVSLISPITAYAAAPRPALQEPPVPQPGIFTPAECMVPIPPQSQDAVNCGYVSVPERHENPDGPKIRLAVVVIKSSDPDAQPDPLFMAQGGPGGSTIDTYTSILLTSQPLLAHRDIVLFDQRGTLYSQPALLCAEYDQLMLDTIEKDLSDEESLQLELQAAKACRLRLEAEGVDLDAYNSLENAADIQAIRQALGYEQINLYGVSYGTLLALHTMRFYPQHLRSVILDAVVPPQINFILQVPQTAQRALDQLFQACAEDKNCDQAYPNLETVFYQVVDQLNQSPVKIAMTDPESGVTYQAPINGDTFLEGIFQLLYIGDLIPAIPRTIYDARNGHFDFFARILSILVFDRTTSYGMYYSVLCAEDADFNASQIDLSGVSDQIAQAEMDGPQAFLKSCTVWDIDPLALPMDEPVSSDIPVLVLSGGFDPITPPAYGQIAAQTLERSAVFVFPTGGHGAALDGVCQDQIIRSFLDDPNTPPDSSCIQPVEQIGFFTPKTVIEAPAILQLFNLQNNRGVEFLILLLAALFIFPAMFVIPIHWLWMVYRNESTRLKREASLKRNMQFATAVPLASSNLGENSRVPRPSWTARISSAAAWMLAFNSLVSWLFLLSLFSIIGLMVANNDNRLFFGIPGQARFLFVMPLMILVTTILLGIAWIFKLTSKKANLFQKLFYAAVFFACLILLYIFTRWGLLWALF